MNGYLASLLVWVSSGLIGLASILFGVVARMHVSRDDERHSDTMKEREITRQRLHLLENAVSRIETRLRWQDEDKPK